MWSKSSRRYAAEPPAWDYQAGAVVHQLSAQVQLQLTYRRGDISRALAGEWVQVVRMDRRVLVYY